MRLRAFGLFASALFAASALATAHCGLFADPGEYTAGGAPTEEDASADVSRDGGAVPPDAVVLPDGNAVPPPSGHIALVAGEREPLSPEDDPAWSADAYTGVIDVGGSVSGWTIEKSAPLVGSFDTGALVGTTWFMVSTGFGLAGGRGTALQSTSWSPGVAGDWHAARANPPGGLDEHSRVIVGSRVFYVGGTRTVPVDGGTNTFFTNEIHAAEIDTAKRELGGSSGTGKQLVVARSRPGLVYGSGHLYVVGGRFGGGITAGVEMVDIDAATGAVATVNEQPAMQADGADHKVFLPSLVVADGYLFVAGGRTSGTNAPTDVVLSSKIDPVTGALAPFQTLTKLPKALRDFAFVAHKGRLYVLGGVTAGTPARTDDVLSATINADGTVGAWSSANAKLPAARSDFVALAY